MSFLPKGYKAPEANSNYLRPIEGSLKVRVIGDTILGFEYWKEVEGKNKPVRLKEAPTEKPEDIKLNDDGSYTIKHFWAFPVIDRNDLGGTIKILELTQSSIMRDVEDYLLNKEWGDITKYDITITGKGSGFDRKYNTIASPHSELTKEEEKLIENTKIELEALFLGEDPFTWEKPVDVE